MPDSTFKQALDAVATAIQGLSLTNLPSDEVRVRRWPWKETDRGVFPHRGITVHPVPEVEYRGTNERDDIGYGIGLTMIVGSDHAAYENVDGIPAWRETIRRNLHRTRLGLSVTGCNELELLVSHGQLNVPKDLFKYEISTLVLRYVMRESRL